MRLIDADALVEDMKENPPSYDMGPVIYAVESAPTVSGWISVKDRLPPNAEHPGAFCPRYLVSTDFGVTVGWYNPDKNRWYGCGWWMYDTNLVKDIDFERGDIPRRVVLPVEAWMHLPEPPKQP